MTIDRNIDLAPYTTFGMHAAAEHVVVVATLDELRQALAWAHEQALPWRILGGGSNVLLTGDVSGLVIVMRMMGRDVTIDGDDVLITCGAGEVWHDIVTWAVEATLRPDTSMPNSRRVSISPSITLGSTTVPEPIRQVVSG